MNYLFMFLVRFASVFGLIAAIIHIRDHRDFLAFVCAAMGSIFWVVADVASRK